MTLALALSYGAREELASVARGLADEACRGVLDPGTIDVGMVESKIPSLGVGEPDLILRTGGEQRLSNFLLYGAAEAELAFSDKLWPDFQVDDLFEAIATYQARRKRQAERALAYQSQADQAQIEQTQTEQTDGSEREERRRAAFARDETHG